MTKRLFILFLVMTLLLCVGCKQKTESPQDPVGVYYKRAQVSFGASDSVISLAYIDAAGRKTDIEYLLNLYLANETGEEHARTFPKGTTLISIKMDALTAKIVLSDSFADLTGIDLSIACACLTQTVISLTNCQEVIISANNAKLDGQNFITLSQDSYLLLDESSDTQE